MSQVVERLPSTLVMEQLFLALFQAFGVAIALEGQQANGLGVVMDPGMGFRIVAVTTLVTGTMFLMWLGEQITERGIGNGISLIIFAGIVAGLPAAIGGTIELSRTGEMHLLAVVRFVRFGNCGNRFCCFCRTWTTSYYG